MAEQVIRPRTVITIALIFLALVGMQLWMGHEEEAEPGVNGQEENPAITIKRGDSVLEIASPNDLDTEELGHALGEPLKLLMRGGPTERHAVSTQLALMTRSASERQRLRQIGQEKLAELREVLLQGLRDEDQVVASNCRLALTGLWRMTDSPSAAEHFQKGIEAYEQGDYQRALNIFNRVEQVTRSVPPDLYRLRAEIHMENGNLERAYEDVRQAIRAERAHFAAFYTLGKLYARRGDTEKALVALKGALTWYPSYPEAQALREQLLQEAEPAS